jgi:hypothetical protein
VALVSGSFGARDRSRHGQPTRRRALAALSAVLASSTTAPACRSLFHRSALPHALRDDEFWALTTSLSEAPGEFPHSDNFVSNESAFVQTMHTLGPMGGAYIGVGPEQNFSFITQLQPAMAFIVDIRAENRALHLLYKALFEGSADRAEFVSRLFSRPRRDGGDRTGSAVELFAALARQPRDIGYRAETLQLIRARLLEQHAFAVAAEDLRTIEDALIAFFLDGPEIHYARLHPSEPRGPFYRELMTATDVAGNGGSYLWDEARFRAVKDLHARNLIVPVVGDFGGTGALRRTGDYIRAHGDVLSALYASNVEVYLNRDKARTFCATLTLLPFNWETWFIGSKAKRPLRLKIAECKAALQAPERSAPK